MKTRDDFQPLHYQRNAIYTMEQALERMKGLIGTVIDWSDLEDYLPEAWRLDPKKRRSALASTFAASLEMVKTGAMEMRQTETFGRIEMKRRVR